MQLYYFPGACSLADHVVLEWIGVPYEIIRMDRDSINSPEYLALNPTGAVPLLVDGDYHLTQNAAILWYLADRYSASQLLGEPTPRGRAEVMRWLSLLNSDLHPAFKPIFSPSRFLSGASREPEIADTARLAVRKYLAILNERLDGREWLADQRSIADPYLFVMLRWAVRFNIDLKEFAHLTRFLERMYADPGVRKSILEEEGETAEYARAAM
ncbi:MAG TPA: glutathione binding-like protein [Steroidobacter sp.]|uniref:glutathione S-transferase family protein n=1 Tax=Steroidobacter sp. TaxID=1978227 RepID=UPI002ED8452D